MPSVFGLFPGAITVKLWTLMFSQPDTCVWKDLLFREVIPLIWPFFTLEKLIDCAHAQSDQEITQSFRIMLALIKSAFYCY
jgi:hypothetical protein